MKDTSSQTAQDEVPFVLEEENLLTVGDIQARLKKLETYIKKVDRRIFKRQQQVFREINIDSKEKDLLKKGVSLLTDHQEGLQI